jgi:hypothetical protein
MGYGPSKQNRGAGNFGEQLVQFKLADAQRIANAVSQVEGQRRGRKGSTLPRAAGGGGGGAISTATFSGSWSKDSEKILTVGGSTANVRNFMQNILYSATDRRCFVTMIDGQYTLLNSECS